VDDRRRPDRLRRRLVLPAAAGLAADALRPHAASASGTGETGLGWILNTARGFAVAGGTGPGGSASLIVRPGDRRVCVALTNRKAQVMPLAARIFRQSS
jgi:hypothetical protein